jgi:hypothetical protein
MSVSEYRGRQRRGILRCCEGLAGYKELSVSPGDIRGGGRQHPAAESRVWFLGLARGSFPRLFIIISSQGLQV